MNIHNDQASVWRKFYRGDDIVKKHKLKESFRLLLYHARPSEEALRFVMENWEFLSTCPGQVLALLAKRDDAEFLGTSN